MQLEITLYPDRDEPLSNAVGQRGEEDETLFTPNGHRRCEHCRKRLHAFAGRLLCVNANCPGVPR